VFYDVSRPVPWDGYLLKSILRSSNAIDREFPAALRDPLRVLRA
jgi:hypothetical protein